MPRKPVQERGKDTVERILAAARLLLAEPDVTPSLRTLAARAGVSLGTLYQYFASMDAIRAEVGRSAAALVRTTLERDVPKELADAPAQFFAALIASLDQLQRSHPELGCMVRPAHRSGFVEGMAADLRSTVDAYVRGAFHDRISDDDLPANTKLDMAIALLTGLLGQAPQRDDAARGAFLNRVAIAANSVIQPSVVAERVPLRT